MGVASSTCFLLDLLLKLGAEHEEKLLELRISERHDFAIKHVGWYGNNVRGNTLTWLVKIDNRNI